jgi:hypothetical protein
MQKTAVLFMNMIVVVIVIVRMRVRNPVMGVLMRVGCAGRGRYSMGVIVVPVVMRVFVRVRDCIVGVRVRMLGHRYLLVGSALNVLMRRT